MNSINFIYLNKSASPSGLVDPTPEMQKSLKDEIEKVTKSYGASATAEFPTFKFSGTYDN